MTNAWENMEMPMSGSTLPTFLIIYPLQPSLRVRFELSMFLMFYFDKFHDWYWQPYIVYTIGILFAWRTFTIFGYIR